MHIGTMETSPAVERFIEEPDRNHFRLTSLIGAPTSAGPSPQGFLVEMLNAEGIISPHFHAVDQFQLVVAGSGTLGKHGLTPLAVHYTDADSPYGPIKGGSEGISFLTLRREGVRGTHYMPASKARKRGRPGRNIAGGVTPPPGADGDVIRLLPEQDDGVGAWLIRLEPAQPLDPPLTGEGGGAYVYITDGTVTVEAGSVGPRGLLFLDEDELVRGALTGGATGASVVVMRFSATQRLPTGE